MATASPRYAIFSSATTTTLVPKVHTKLHVARNTPDVGMDIAEAVRKAGVLVGYDQLKDEQVNIIFVYFRGRERCVCIFAYWLWEELVLHAPSSRVGLFWYLAVESGGGKAIAVVISPLIALMEDQVASLIQCQRYPGDMDKKASVTEGASYQLVLFSTNFKP